MDNKLTCKEVADRYGLQVRTVWGWVRDKRVPATRVGKQYYISLRDLEEIEEAGRTVKQ